jgi:hypothetical protein
VNDALSPPEDLVELKMRWYVLKAECDRIAAEPPEGDYLRGSYEMRRFSDEQNARLDAARARLRGLTLEVARHPWKARQENRNAAEQALNAAARARLELAAGDGDSDGHGESAG